MWINSLDAVPDNKRIILIGTSDMMALGFFDVEIGLFVNALDIMRRLPPYFGLYWLEIPDIPIK